MTPDESTVEAFLDGRQFVVVSNREPHSHDYDGVLVLSDAAGVAEELGDYALTVTPMDVEVFAERIRQAVELPPSGRERHTRALKSVVESSGTEDWIRAFFAPLAGDSDPSVDEVYTIGE